MGQSGNYYTGQGEKITIQSHIVWIFSIPWRLQEETELGSQTPNKSANPTGVLVIIGSQQLRPLLFISQHTDAQRQGKSSEACSSGGTACREGGSQVHTFPASSPCPSFSPSLLMPNFNTLNPGFPKSLPLTCWTIMMLAEAGGSCFYLSAS